MKVCVVAEYYPRQHDPVLGIWAHRQALAARDAGAEVHVVVLHRPIPPRSTPRRELPAATARLAAHPRRRIVDATPILHQVPVAGGYGREEAVAEARAFLAGRPYVPRDGVR